MRAVILISMCLSLSFANAHQYFFSFAEVEYNDVTEKFEATITATTHDLERSMSDELSTAIVLDDSDEHYMAIEHYLNGHFRIETGTVKGKFTVVGHEISLNGTVNFYLESAPIKMGKIIRFTFDLLMDNYPDQQNKITFYHRGRSYTRPFHEADRSQTINLETEIK